ncbi:threonine/homoserine efflux transporter RhtA [Hasllibacter halocynthiae]|uniref:Threonine/homoserine efflux transporter RhtA n=1 Tax=Hasllibacter halocynthiae TaxID=595589 RepID=A0A2T0X3E6_9RHOB|nr:DMT family transporter [Hasllibacter halocynthiae]PRY93384.1 threonine/homoserine efflux transporter RhtA [Hasllibacter halocynthiae]
MSDAAASTLRRLDFAALALGVAFALMWASAFTSARIIVETAPPVLILALRFALSGVLALLLSAALGERMRLTAAQWRAAVLFGIFQNCLYLGLNFAAMRTVEASLAAIVASTMPLLVSAALWFGGERLPRAGIMGLGLGFAGAALVMGTRLSAGVDPGGFALCVVGVLALTFATLALRGAISGGNPMFVVGVQMLVAAVFLGPVGAALEEWDVVWTARLGWAFLYTLLIPGLAATYVWFRLVARIGATRAATFHFLTPPFGVLIAWAFLGEGLAWSDMLGVAVVAAGILLVQRARGD